MALTEIDKKLIDKMLADGKTKEEIPGLLAKAKEKLGLSGGSFMTRAASAVELSPGATEGQKETATMVKEKFPEINAAVSEQREREEAGSIGSQLSAAKDIGEGGALAVGNLAGFALGKPIEWIGEKTGSDFTERFGKNIQTAASDILGEAKTDQEKLGRSIGQNILTTGLAIMNPVSGKLAGGGSSIASKFTGSKWLQGMAGRLAASPLDTAVFTAGMSGEAPTKGELGLGAFIDAMLPVGLQVLGKGKDVAKNFLGDIWNSVKYKNISPMAQDVYEKVINLGTSPEATKVKQDFFEIIKKFKDNIKNPSKNLSPAEELGTDLFDTFQNKIIPTKQAIGQELAGQIAQMDTLATAGGGKTSAQILESFTSAMESIGVKIENGILNFKGPESTIRFSDANQSMLKKVYDDLTRYVSEGSFMPASEKWAFSQSLDDLIEYNSKLGSQVTTKGEIPLTSLKADLMTDVKNSLEESGQAVDLFDQYATLSDAISTLNARFGDGGEGGRAILDAIFGKGKFGVEVRNALDTVKNYTGLDYGELMRMVKSAGEIAGDTTVKSLMAEITNPKGLISKAADNAVFNKQTLIDRLEESIKENGTPLNLDRSTLDLIVTSTLKLLMGQNKQND